MLPAAEARADRAAFEGPNSTGTRAHALGLQVHVWTINDRTEMTCLLDLGADGIMTDQTVLLRDVLAERGQWHPGAAAGPAGVPDAASAPDSASAPDPAGRRT